jgi:hypothetical protein
VKELCKAADPIHGRVIPRGRKVAAALRVIFRRQAREVLRQLRANPQRTPSLASWTQPMADALEPLMRDYYAQGIKESLARIRHQLRQRGPHAQSMGRDSRRAGVQNRQTRQENQKVPQGFELRADRLAARREDVLHRNAIEKDEGDPRSLRDIIQPDAFDVFNPKILEAIKHAVFQFCDSTNATAVKEASAAQADLRAALAEGLEEGESLKKLTERVQKIFTDPNRAIMIAASESSRAVHSGLLIAARESGVVKALRWLASADACDRCLALNGKEVPLGHPFAVVGTGPYSIILHCPLHPL